YLFPETYDFGPEPTSEAVVQKMYREFDRHLTSPMRVAASARGLSVHEVVTLASIIEREATQTEERAQVAAVFHNRLARGMPLEADPTAQYGLVAPGTLLHGVPYWKPQLGSTDLAVDSLF